MSIGSQDFDCPFFLEFEKIPQDLSKWNDCDLKKVKKWIVLEKIHGANFSFYIAASKTVRIAKRSSFITISDYFFGVHHTAFIPEISLKLQKLFDHSVELFPETIQLSLHGELFGGKYPHPLVVPSSLPIVPVQTAVVYTPELCFIIYDIAKYNLAKERDYLDYDLVIKLCEQFDLPYCRPLFIGKLNDVQSFDLNFPSKIPSLYGLPKLCDLKNFAEGIVVKPIKNISFFTRKGLKRVIFKRKHPNFIEISHATYSISKFQPFKEDYIKHEILPLVNHNRVQSSIGKCGFPCNEKDLESLIKSILDDVLIDFCDSTRNLDKWQDLNDEKKNYFNSIISEKISDVIIQEFKNFDIPKVV